MVEKLYIHEKKNKKSHSHKKDDHKGHDHSHHGKEKSTKVMAPSGSKMVLEDIAEDPKDMALANMKSLTSSKDDTTPKNQPQNSELAKNKAPFASNGTN